MFCMVVILEFDFILSHSRIPMQWPLCQYISYPFLDLHKNQHCRKFVYKMHDSRHIAFLLEMEDKYK